MKPTLPTLCLCFILGTLCSKSYDEKSVLGTDEVLVKIDGTAYTTTDLPKDYRLDFERIRYNALSSLHRLSYRFALDKILKLESEKRGLDEAGLVREVTGEEVYPTDAQIKSYYEFNDNKFPDGLYVHTEEIRSILIRARVRELRNKAALRLISTYRITPQVSIPKIEIDTENPSSRGDKAARLTVYEFVDFSSVDSIAFQKIHEELRQEYTQNLRWTILQLPNPKYPPAWAMHRIVSCAGNQEQFWPVFFQLVDNQQLILSQAEQFPGNVTKAYFALEQKALQAAGTVSGVDSKKLAGCAQSADLADKKFEEDLELAGKYRIGRAPFYIINGSLYKGPMPKWQFWTIFDSILERAGIEPPRHEF